MNLIKSIISFVRTVISSLLLIILIIFMVNNRDEMTIHLYPLPFEVQTKTFMVMITFFIMGMLFGFLIFSKKLLVKTFSNFRSGYKIKKLEKKLESKNQK